MTSLRSRVLLVPLAVILAGWIGGCALLAVQFTREQSGWWDKVLANIAVQILASLPVNVDSLDASATLTVPSEANVTHDGLNFQIWSAQSRLLLRSPGAPNTPLKPDFVTGGAMRTLDDGEAWRVYSIGDVDGRVHVQVAKSRSRLHQDLRRWGFASLITATLAFLAVAAGMWCVIRHSFKPVDALRNRMAGRAPLDLSPLDAPGLPDELRPLVASFNRLLQQVDGAIETEKRFIADAAHELRTPTAALLAHADRALRSAADEHERDVLRKLVAGVERSARMAEQWCDLARLDAGERAGQTETLDLAPLVIVVTRDFEESARAKDVSIALDAEPCTIMGQTDPLGILIRNLVDNALRYVPAGGRIAVACCMRPDEGPRFSVADNGPGIPMSERARVFDRFYRVPGNGQRGSGIGLSLVARIAQMHDASIDLDEGLDGRGLTVTVRFPRAAENAHA